MILNCVCLFLMWILCVYSTQTRHDARVKDTDQGVIHYSIESRGHSDFIKLVKSGLVWVADHKNLYSINTTTQVKTSQFKDECEENPKCDYTISLLKEELDGSLLICRSTEEKTKCYNLNSDFSVDESFQFDYGFNINEPSLLMGDVLYFTKSNKGLFRINRNKPKDKIWPDYTVSEQKFVKLVASKDKEKVYSFFTEKQRCVSKDCEPNVWTPRVSQICANDRGGSKHVLQFSWTSAIYARLFCGGVEGERPFTHIIDVDTVETHNDIRIYVLFKNLWNMSAVCVYKMSEISRVFNFSEIMNMNNVKAPAGHRPGQCVADSTALSPEVLKFMKEGPEVKGLILPETGPMIFHHHHYTHIQVHTLHKTTVLYLALESGGVHKVLEDYPVFIMAEFRPFPRGTHISSLLLDTSENRLYVSSGRKVTHIDLQMCHVYGDDCYGCFLSRDPYCAWNGSHCAPIFPNPDQEPRICDSFQVAESRTETYATGPVTIIPSSSRYYMLCPTVSHHASYHWYHGNNRLECVQSHHGCLFLIESMNETYEGSYRCESIEGDYQKNISRYELRMNTSPTLTLNNTLLPCLLLLLTHLLS